MDDAAVSVLIDDQAPFGRAAAAVVTVTGGFEVAGEAASSGEFGPQVLQDLWSRDVAARLAGSEAL